jgi:DNA-binding MarR family transcriptional regulator
MMPASDTLPRRADNVLLQMFRTGHAVRELMAHAVAGTGVSGDEWAVLSAVGVFRSVAPTQLATVLRIPPTSISRYVARLVSLDLVVRVPNEADGRSYLLELTEEGRSKVEAISPRFRALVTGLDEHADMRAIESALIELEQAAKALFVDTATADR